MKAIVVFKDQRAEIHNIPIKGNQKKDRAIISYGSDLNHQKPVAGIAYKKGLMWGGHHGSFSIFETVVPSLRADNDIPFGQEVPGWYK
jgi:hypothetical protein